MASEFFDWVKDVEETYKYLIEKAKDKNQEEIEEFRIQQEELMKLVIRKKKKIIQDALGSFS